MIPPGTHLPRPVLLRVFLRSLFLQASWNPKGMQNLGLAYALYPALEVLYPDPEKRGEAVQRHLTFFNTHPYVAAAIVGGVLYHEERISKGEEDPSRVNDFKRALMGPLAALGDGFFWLSLKPAVGAFCAALVPWLGAWAAVPPEPAEPPKTQFRSTKSAARMKRASAPIMARIVLLAAVPGQFSGAPSGQGRPFWSSTGE